MEINNSNVMEVEAEGKTHYKYFACTCAEEDSQYWQQALSDYCSDNTTHVTSALIMELEHSYDTWVEAISCDMWFGISLRNSTQTFFIECDLVEYGLLVCVKILELLAVETNP